MKWGSYAVIDEVQHNFEKAPDFWWKFKAPTSGDELKMSKFLSQNRYVVDADGSRREYPPTWTEICHRELGLTFAGTNIPKDGFDGKRVEEGGDPILKDKATVEQVEVALRTMPHEMVLELWGALGNVVPDWGPQRPKSTPPLQAEEDSTSES